MRALCETMPLHPGQDLLLLYRGRTAADLPFTHELRRIAEHRRARVHYLVGERVGQLSPSCSATSPRTCATAASTCVVHPAWPARSALP